MLFSLCHVPTVCDPVDCSMPGFPVLHYLLEFAQSHVHSVSNAIQPSHLLLAFSHIVRVYLLFEKRKDLFNCIRSQLWHAGSFVAAHELQLWCVGLVLVVCELQSAWVSVAAALRLSSCVMNVLECMDFSSCSLRPQFLHIMWDLSFQTRNQAHHPCITARWILNHWTTRKVPGLYLLL